LEEIEFTNEETGEVEMEDNFIGEVTMEEKNERKYLVNIISNNKNK
jgi:hypothetical protein